MVDRQERQQQRMGEIPEWEGLEREEEGGEGRSVRVGSPLYGGDEEREREEG